jgi:nucleotide-binding universal stress UspA family protein
MGQISLKHRETPLVLFGTQGRPDDELAIRTVCRFSGMFDPRNVLLRIVHILTVPMSAPLDVCLPDAEEASTRILRRADAVARAVGVAVRTATLRGRTVAEALVDDACRTRANAIVVRLRNRETIGAHVLLSLTVRALLRDAPYPVLLLHLAHGRMGGHVGKNAALISNNRFTRHMESSAGRLERTTV